MSRRSEKTKARPPVELLIDGLSHEGRGLSRVDGKRIFVEGALPGEQVLAQYTFTHKKYDEARVLEIRHASPDRVTPPCEHFDICGGCSMQHMSRDAQIAYKQSVLAEHFLHFGGLQPEEWLPPLLDDATDYRRKARLGVKYVIKKETLMVGFREKKSNFLADIRSCVILDNRISSLLLALREVINGLAQREQVVQIEVAAGDDDIALIFRHMAPLPESDVQALTAFMAERNWMLYLQPGGPDTVHRVYPEQAEDRLSYALPDFGLTMHFHPTDFTQVNAGINRKMLNLALELLDPQPGDRVLDLFCGLGNFTLPLATRAGEVVGVEGVQAMADRGMENAKRNNLSNVSFYAQDLTADFSQQPWARQGFDRLLIDPPRSGAEEIVKYLPKFKAKRIVYVSCNPATLARDAGLLKEAGYRLVKAGVMDMFTHTTHVESIAVFER
ncbi:MAG TPA: 23S rRNA (uracil(1939)-C(5))-methyltransferase RlmD [Moraxellaceae bacterium]|nr:23S rRNA (uracil(1939)-C(5))-methyltransferase RlmD [Moraxellaceae bacterium]HQV41268.1 23S rRNA (uracil(1939)-C(5))-methyltransferase RlmD [Moraxellaceae bacterium]HQX89442.1 23S rRNA (uracil(1939)-C(5))-methyltransferase RlmD [Moraxellaceae bacterium]